METSERNQVSTWVCDVIQVKVIKPHTPFKSKVFLDAIKSEQKKVGDDIKKDFEKTTKTWKHKVVFRVQSKESGSQSTVNVFTTDKIYGYVDEGTRAHIIRPKKAKALSFKGIYRTKTKPHVINSSSGGSSGKQVFAQEVHHPGTDPRYFARDIQAKWQPQLSKRIQTTINKAAKQSGHSITK